MNFVVLGAGAVGSVLGGFLALQKHDVLLVCRDHHADAIAGNGGLRLRSATGDYFAQLRANSRLDRADLADDTCVFITAKSYDTDECLDQLSSVAPAKLPVVCFQNGVSNEEKAAERFENVYGGVCRMTCSMIQGGQASFRRFGRVLVGRFPKGSDTLAKNLVKFFSDAGCHACASRNITADKWLKLAVNTQSTFHAIVDPRDHEANEFYDLKVSVLEEAKKVLKAHKVKPRSCDGKDMTIDEIIADLRRPRALRHSSGIKVPNSTWQNLYLKRDEIENEYFHGPVIELGRKYNIPVPYNEVALELVAACHRNQTGPGSLRLSDVLAAV
ncbi:MAG: 2-dehydropantoate 2-reductase, partial [Candidatus Latescibacterota bacterium]